MGVVAAQLEQMGGYALIHRRLLEHPVFQNEVEAWAFASLIMRASWKPCRVGHRSGEVLLERGQFILSVRDFAEIWGWSKSKADRFLQRLEKDSMIVRSWDRAGTPYGTGASVITICNYDKFQTINQSDGTGAGTRGGTVAKNTGKEAPSKDNNKLLSKGSPKRTAWQGEGEPPLEWVDWAVGNMGWSRRQSEAEAMRFIDNAAAHRRLYVDWLAAWRNWCRSPFQKTVAKQEVLSL